MSDRPHNRETEYEQLRPGAPPRDRSEPAGSEGSAQTDKLRTDPATGETQHPVPAPDTGAPDTSAMEERAPQARRDERADPTAD